MHLADIKAAIGVKVGERRTESAQARDHENGEAAPRARGGTLGALAEKQSEGVDELKRHFDSQLALLEARLACRLAPVGGGGGGGSGGGGGEAGEGIGALEDAAETPHERRNGGWWAEDEADVALAVTAAASPGAGRVGAERAGVGSPPSTLGGGTRRSAAESPGAGTPRSAARAQAQEPLSGGPKPKFDEDSWRSVSLGNASSRRRSMHLLSLLPALDSGDWGQISPGNGHGAGDSRRASSFKEPKQVIESEEESQSARRRRMSLPTVESNQSRDRRQTFVHVAPAALEKHPTIANCSNDLMIVPRRISRQNRRKDVRIGREDLLHHSQHEAAASTVISSIPDNVSEQETISKGSASRSPTGDRIESKRTNGTSSKGGSRGVVNSALFGGNHDDHDQSLYISRTSSKDVAREIEAETPTELSISDDQSGYTPHLTPP
jgi:hypothetical protein